MCRGQSIGAHKDVVALMRGIFNSRPPVTKNYPTWDVNIVLDYLKSLGSTLTLKMLSVKLAVLLMLTNGSRSSDLAALDLSTRKFLPDGVVFKFAHIRKTTRVDHHPDVFYSSFPSNPDLCVVECLKQYEKRTGGLRSSSRLLISFIKPHKPVTTATIARWVLYAMKCAGINVEEFKAHSCRSAAVTKARNKGISIKDIQNAADWTSPSTFLKYYYKPSYSCTFSNSILGEKSLDQSFKYRYSNLRRS